MNRWLWRIAIGMSLALVAMSLTLAGWALYDRFSETNTRRAAQQRVNNENRETWRKVLCFARDEVVKSPAPAAQKAQAVKFYKDALKLVGARPCPPLKGAK